MPCLRLMGMTHPGAIAFIYYVRTLPKVHTCVCEHFVSAFFAKMCLPGGKRLRACSAGQCDRVSGDRSLEKEPDGLQDRLEGLQQFTLPRGGRPLVDQTLGGRQLVDEGVELVVGQCPVDPAVALGGVGVEILPACDDLQRAGAADQARQPVDASAARHDAEAYLRLREERRSVTCRYHLPAKGSQSTGSVLTGEGSE